MTVEASLPQAAPEDLPESLEAHIIQAPDTPSGRLRWEQRILPQLAAHLAKVAGVEFEGGLMRLFRLLLHHVFQIIDKLADGHVYVPAAVWAGK